MPFHPVCDDKDWEEERVAVGDLAAQGSVIGKGEAESIVGVVDRRSAVTPAGELANGCRIVPERDPAMGLPVRLARQHLRRAEDTLGTARATTRSGDAALHRCPCRPCDPSIDPESFQLRMLAPTDLVTPHRPEGESTMMGTDACAIRPTCSGIAAAGLSIPNQRVAPPARCSVAPLSRTPFGSSRTKWRESVANQCPGPRTPRSDQMAGPALGFRRRASSPRQENGLWASC